MRVDDPELFGLISALIQLISTSYPNLYSNLCNLQLYLPRPQATLVARTLIEYGEESTIEQFVDDIESKLFDLIHAQDLSEVISSLLIRGPQKRRESIFNKLSPIFNDMIMNPYQWKILHTLLSVVSMRQKINLATIIVQSVSFPSKPPYLDILIIHALESVDMQSRIQLWHNNMALVHDPQLTRVPEYLARLEKRMLALRNEYTKM
ncbi:hypothetical protein GPJ56_010072 [Histomonas meleagridis]|uniref:uncharacterized protein n=1 Tax=Histomonas meleagridis TaxID=135588 RepID=UPI0035596119|nr:hypothetical protein GPJ56_010072 [Histomonas meleagridis]KAH0805858.1 hypothetical protein GO595_001348 [Histomonas meleagridis]